MSSDTSYSEIPWPWPSLTEDDYVRLDRGSEVGATIKPELGDDKGAASISIAVEGFTDGELKRKRSKSQEPVEESPFVRHRRKGYLSVSDLVSPAWCEVQFDYGLRQRRSLPLQSRAKSFETKKGKTITVQADVAKKNDRVMTKGKVVHKKLEKQIHKQEIFVPFEAPEEQWALRILDLLLRLKTLKETAICRELSVWGVVCDEAVIGIIDEIRLERKEPHISSVTPASKPSPKRSDSQTSLDIFFPDDISLRPRARAKPGEALYSLRIIDNKTRTSDKLPTYADTLPSRLQLMMYWKLLSQVLELSPSTLNDFCGRLRLNAKCRFSKTFVIEMSNLVVDNDFDLSFLDAECLEDMVIPYTNTLRELGFGCEVNNQLSLVYRRRDGDAKNKTKSDSSSTITRQENAKNAPAEGSDTVISTNDAEMANTEISALGEVKAPPPMDGTLEIDPPQSELRIDNGEDAALKPSPSRKRKNSVFALKVEDSATKEGVKNAVYSYSFSSDESGGASAALAHRIIGTRKFFFDQKLLDSHLESILLWWHGKRSPRGVNIENSYRCNSCEYKNGCEWREEKAEEISAKYCTSVGEEH